MFNKELSIWLNGQFLPVDEAKVSVLTHALHYGTSVFEGVRCYNKQIFKAAEHAKRLLYSAEVVGLSLNYSVSQLVETMEHLIGLNGLSNGYIRPIAWLGDESLGIYAPDNKTHIAIAAWEWPSVFDQNVVELGVKLVTSPYRRPPAIAAPYKAKAAGVYLNGAISRQLAAKEGADDALMLNCEGNIAEATGANIFFCQGKQLITPIADCFLSGITRETVIELAKQNQYEVIERKIAYEEIKQFDGCFLTGTAYEVQLVRAIDSTNFNNNELATSMRQLYLKTVQV